MDYQALYPWAPQSLLEEVSTNTSRDQIVALRKEKCQHKYRFGRESDIALRIIPCREDELVCCDESLDLEGSSLLFLCHCLEK